MFITSQTEHAQLVQKTVCGMRLRSSNKRAHFANNLFARNILALKYDQRQYFFFARYLPMICLYLNQWFAFMVIDVVTTYTF